MGDSFYYGAFYDGASTRISRLIVSVMDENSKTTARPGAGRWFS